MTFKSESEPDHFGDCPKCFEESRIYHNDGHIDVRQTHFYICTIHKVAWCVGSNLFSAWRHGNEESWARNLRMLEEEYEPVEPYHPPQWLTAQLTLPGCQN
jgi:hypothetical protein